jgi:cell division protein FtsL
MLRADVQTSFFRRFLWIAIACVVGIAWCVFDAQVTYPKKQVIAEAYESLADTEDRDAEWTQLAEQNGWSTDKPSKSSAEVQAQIFNQYIMIAICGVVGCLMLLKWYLPRGSWIEGNETQFTDSRGRRVVLDELEGMDLSRWEEKGIAVLRFSGDQGASKFVLDDFKYDQEVTDQLLEIAKEKLHTLQSAAETAESGDDGNE